MITKYDNYLLEFKSEDVKLILTELVDYFTIGFEIEIEIKPEILKGLKESNLMYPSRQNKKMMDDFKRSFPNFYEKYKNRISFHDDETIIYGIEIVNSVSELPIPFHGMSISGLNDKQKKEEHKPFNNINDAIKYINDFFMDYEDQDHWLFTHRTSIHINVGSYENVPINVTKGVMMISDQEKEGFVFKGIENRLVNYCASLKQKLIDMFKKKPNKELMNSTNIKDWERYINSEIFDLYDYSSAKLFGMIFKKNYVEFRYIGGDKVNENIMKDKILYFCYLLYLMSSEYRNKEYVRKLFSFINKLR